MKLKPPSPGEVAELERQLDNRGLMNRILGGYAKRIDSPWKMYPRNRVSSPRGASVAVATPVSTNHRPFTHEVTYLDTRTAGGMLKPFRGLPVHTAHAVRNEFGPIFTF